MVARRLLYNVGSRKLIAAIERAHQCVLNPLAGLVVQYPVLRIGDVEDVLGALAYGHDLRAVDGDALGFEYLPDLGQEAGPVGRDQFQDRAAVAGVQAEIDLRRCREHAHLARRAAGHDERRIFGLLEVPPETALDFLQPLRVGYHRAVVLQYYVGLQTEAISAGDQARVDDVQSHLIQHRGGAREAVQAIGCIRENDSPTAVGELPDRDEWRVVVRVAAGKHARLPCDLLGRVAQKVRLGPLRPYGRDPRVRYVRHLLACVRLGLADQLVLIDRRFEPAA